MRVHDGTTKVLRAPPQRFPADAVVGLYDEEKDLFYRFADYTIEGQPKRYLVLGRGRKCDVQIADAAVSYAHCDLIRGDDGTCTVKDAGSKNGIRVNDLRVTEKTRLLPGMWLGVGRTVLTAIGANSIPVLAVGYTTFLARSQGYHGSSHEAVDHVKKSQSTIARAAGRYRERKNLPRNKKRRR